MLLFDSTYLNYVGKRMQKKMLDFQYMWLRGCDMNQPALVSNNLEISFFSSSLLFVEV